MIGPSAFGDHPTTPQVCTLCGNSVPSGAPLACPHKSTIESYDVVKWDDNGYEPEGWEL